LLSLRGRPAGRRPPVPRRSAKFSSPQPISTRQPHSCSPRATATGCWARPCSSGISRPGRTGRRHHRATRRGALLGAYGRPPLPAPGHSAQLERRRLQPMAVRQPRGGTAAPPEPAGT